MLQPVLITEILRRADTGVSVTPFICRTEDEPFLIDHDNAFDPEFSPTELRTLHLGWQSRSHWLCSIERELWEGHAASALARLPDFWAEVPQSWLKRSPELSENPDRALDSLCAILTTPFAESANFWEPITSTQS